MSDQQVDITIKFTMSIPIENSRDTIILRMRSWLAALVINYSRFLVKAEIIEIKEEAEIYGNQ